MARPINDNFDKAIVIRGDGFTYSGNTAEATNQYPDGEPIGYDDVVWDSSYSNYELADDKSVWFTYTAEGEATVEFSVLSASFNTQMTVFYNYNGPGAVNNVGDLTAGTSSVSFDTWAGQQFWIRLSGDLDQGGDYVFAQTAGPAGVSTAILGTSGADVLGTLFDGAQEMIGGDGDDAYYVDSTDDVVTETGGEGYDSIYTLVNYTLPANVEKIVALGSTGLLLTGNALDNQLFGAAGADTLYGGLGNDKLDGRAGADSMVGGDGDDSYYVNDAGDVVVELADEGTDTVYTTIDYALSANIEKVIVRGSAGLAVTGNGSDNVMTGGSGADTLSGGEGADRINGGAGADVLIGGADNDVLTGGAGADIFVFAGVDQGRDTITDFQIGVDKIGIDLAAFDLASFDAGLFESNARGLATDADTRFVYSETTGRLFFDADGSGSGKAVLIATLRGAPELTAADFTDASLLV